MRYFKNALLLIILMRLDSNLFRHSELMEKCNILMYIQTLHVSSLILERSVLEGITNIYIYIYFFLGARKRPLNATTSSFREHTTCSHADHSVVNKLIGGCVSVFESN